MRGLRLETGRKVGVGIEGKHRAGAARLLRYNPRMHTLDEGDAGMRMAEILDLERRQAGPVKRALRALAHDTGLDRAPVGPGKGEIVVVLERTELRAAHILTCATEGEHFGHGGVDRNGARASMRCGRRECQALLLDALLRLADARPARLEVEFPPAKDHDLTEPCACQHGQPVGSSMSVPRRAASAPRMNVRLGLAISDA